MNKRKLFIENSGLIIRPVGENEMETILEVYRMSEDFLALGPEPEASKEMIMSDMVHSHEAGGVFCGIYRQDDQLIGVVDFIPEGYDGNKAAAYLELLMLAQPYRSLGLGGVVVRLVEAEILKTPQVEVIYSHVQVNNPKALAFWQRMGYRTIGAAVERPDGTTVLPMKKTLRE
jgi:RimJ/RimL family protein N-acetyltransferase